MLDNRIEQRQQNRLPPASPEMCWCAARDADVMRGKVIDVSRGGLSFAPEAGAPVPNVDEQIIVRFRNVGLRPLIYVVVRHGGNSEALIVGCKRVLRPGAQIARKGTRKNLAEVRNHRRLARINPDTN